jgi:micrococcal nuclease
MKINKKVNKKNRSFIFTYLILLVITVLSIYLFFNLVKVNPPQMLTKNEPEFSMVKRVIDGDTIELENGEMVRYLGIDTPEIQQKECGSEESSNFNKNLVENKKVRLLKDITDKDSYGRILRYVFTEDGQFVNYLLVRNGLAQTLPIPPDTLFDKTFEDALKTAKKENLGIWGKCFNQGEGR